MPDEKNFMRWHFGSQASKDRIIVNLMDEVAELKRDKAEREARKGVPSLIIEMGQRTKPPNFIA